MNSKSENKHTTQYKNQNPVNKFTTDEYTWSLLVTD